MNRTHASFAALLLALIAGGSPSATADMTYAELSIQSQAGDFIGQGQTKDITYTQTNSQFFGVGLSVSATNQPDYLSFVLGTVTGSNSTNTFTTLDFSTAQLGIAFQAGTYGLPGNTAERAAFASPGHAGLDVSFQNRGSNTLTGNFKVNSVSFFTDANNALEIGNLNVNFEQHSEGATPALFGHFIYHNALAPSAVPEPSSLALCGIAGVVGLARWGRRRFDGLA